VQVFSQLCLERGDEILPPELLGSASSSCELVTALLPGQSEIAMRKSLLVADYTRQV